MHSTREKSTLLPVYNPQLNPVRAFPNMQILGKEPHDREISEEELSNLILKLDALNLIILSPAFFYLYHTGFRRDEFNHWLVVLSLVQLMCPSIYGLAHTIEALRPFRVQVTGCFYLILIGAYMIINGSCRELGCRY